MSPLISVIVNCRNGSKYLEECLQSVKKQQYTNWELIFYDNQSTDESKKIFEKNFCNKFKYYKSTKLETLYAARNIACSFAKGEYIAFLDTDDFWLENYLSLREEFFKNNVQKFSFSNCLHKFEFSKKINIFTKLKIPNGCIINFLSKNYLVKISCLIVEKKIFEDIGKFNPNYNIIGDYDLVMKLASNYQAHAVQKPSAVIRFHGKNFLDLNRKMFYQEYRQWFLNLDNRNQNIYKNKKYFFIKLLYLWFVSSIPKKIVNLLKKK
tara:strand:- start:33114 stop:33911 length:798 start_codon:yes stop_codon:yes gene_type:complete